MALFDNKHWLLCNIKHSFMSSDDTEMCEAVMLGLDIPHQLPPVTKFDCYPELCDADAEDLNGSARSGDIQSDSDFGGHRRRSNTAQRLEKMRKERKSASKAKTVYWKDHSSILTAEEKAEFFAPKQVKSEAKKRVSALAELLEKFPDAHINPFMEYAKFDGSTHMVSNSKKVAIFMTMLPSDKRDYPLQLVVSNNAKVQDVIGLTCWKCMNLYRDVHLKEGVEKYSLYMAEDDGEVDWDFPCLDPREAFSKFGFNVLALVEKPQVEKAEGDVATVILEMPDGEMLQVQADRTDISLHDILVRALHKKKGIMTNIDVNRYRVQKRNQPGENIDLEVPISEVDSLQLRVINENIEVLEAMNAKAKFQGQVQAMAAPLYESYHVALVHRMRAKTDILLGISGEKIEIHPLQQKQSKFWPRAKATSYDVGSVVSCELVMPKGHQSPGQGHQQQRGSQNQQGLVRLALRSEHGYKRLEFETDCHTALEMVRKVNHILEMCSSDARKDYMAFQEMKML